MHDEGAGEDNVVELLLFFIIIIFATFVQVSDSMSAWLTGNCLCLVMCITIFSRNSLFLTMGFDNFNTAGDLQCCFDIDKNVTCKILDLEQLKPLHDLYKFSFLHLNVRSLNRRYDDLASLLSILGRSFHVIVCSETWVSDRSYLELLTWL